MGIAVACMRKLSQPAPTEMAENRGRGMWRPCQRSDGRRRAATDRRRGPVKWISCPRRPAASWSSTGSTGALRPRAPQMQARAIGRRRAAASRRRPPGRSGLAPGLCRVPSPTEWLSTRLDRAGCPGPGCVVPDACGATGLRVSRSDRVLRRARPAPGLRLQRSRRARPAGVGGVVSTGSTGTEPPAEVSAGVDRPRSPAAVDPADLATTGAEWVGAARPAATDRVRFGRRARPSRAGGVVSRVSTGRARRSGLDRLDVNRRRADVVHHQRDQLRGASPTYARRRLPWTG